MAVRCSARAAIRAGIDHRPSVSQRQGTRLAARLTRADAAV